MLKGSTSSEALPIGKFVRDNWAWIVGRVSSALGVLAVLSFFSSCDPSAPFLYDI